MMLNSIFSEALFWGPILIISLQKLGHLSLTEIYIQEAVCVVICFLVDIPTGALADIIGRKKMIIIGESLCFIDFLFFAFMSEPWHTWVANILWAFGVAFTSGADKALIQESCIALGHDRDYYRRYAGRAQGLRLLMFSICGPIASWVAEYNLRLPLLMCIPFLLISVVVVCMLTEPPREDVKQLGIREHLLQMKEGILDTLRDKRILWIMLYLCIMNVVSKIWFFAYNPYFEAVGVPLWVYGWIFCLLNITSWFTSRYGHVVEKKLGDKLTVIVLIPLLSLPIIIMGILPTKGMALMVLFPAMVRGIQGPFFDSMSGHYLRNATRATVLSVQSSITNAMAAFGLLVFGFLNDWMGLMASFVVLGVTSLLAYILLISKWRGVFETK